jgi:hypothetical protein
MRNDLLFFISIAFGAIVFISSDILISLFFGEIGIYYQAFGESGYYIFLFVLFLLVLFLSGMLKAEKVEKFKKDYQLGAMRKPIKLLKNLSIILFASFSILLLFLLSFAASSNELKNINSDKNISKWEYINEYIEQKLQEEEINDLKNNFKRTLWI